MRSGTTVRAGRGGAEVGRAADTAIGLLVPALFGAWILIVWEAVVRGAGIPFTQVGDIITYRGRRAPFRITREELLGNLHPECKRLLEQLVHTLQ